MPLIRKDGPRSVPDWADYYDWGINKIAKGAYFESHFHDHHEFVVLVSGRMKTHTEGQDIVMEAGDVLLTEMGESHDWLALEDSVAFWAGTRLQGQKRPGHLTKDGIAKH